MAKKRMATKESESLNVKESKSSEIDAAQQHGSSERYSIKTPKHQDVQGPGRADVGAETPERPVAAQSDTFRLQISEASEVLRRQDRKVKLTLYLPADLAQRFAVHAAMLEQDRSELFAEMVRAHCTRFEIRDRGAPSAPGPGA